ncbi:MAG: YheT family hydrolase [Phototrophicaceae bacterium]|jgi:predicted alpha/beta-fold hydrolase
MRLNTHIEFEPFIPNLLLRNPHIQTVVGASARATTGITFRRERIDTPDGDFVDLDFADVQGATWAQLGEDKPIVLFLHGMEGNARSGAAHEIYRYLSRRGVRCVGLNLRSCSGELNRTPRSYHAGFTEDLALVHNLLLDRYPNTPIGLVGISLGANILLKYLGEGGESLVNRTLASVAISPPFDLQRAQQMLDNGLQRAYVQRFLYTLTAKITAQTDMLKDLVDVPQARKIRTMLAFDNLYTARLHGFKDAADYYAHSSCGQFLGAIRVPTLILRAVDDPFFDPADIPYGIIEHNPALTGVFPQYGGHVGFVEGTALTGFDYWAERQASRYLALMV